MRIGERIEIEEWELTEQFALSGGPGGQNVNKTETAVELRFEAQRSPNLPPSVKTRLRRLSGRRWTKDGAVVIRVTDTRSQAKNRQIARARLADLVEGALRPPKKRIPTRPSRASVRRRLDEKTKHGRKKSLRGKVEPKPE